VANIRLAELTTKSFYARGRHLTWSSWGLSMPLWAAHDRQVMVVFHPQWLCQVSTSLVHLQQLCGTEPRIALITQVSNSTLGCITTAQKALWLSHRPMNKNFNSSCNLRNFKIILLIKSPVIPLRQWKLEWK
jgi:hypothetical protein